MLRTFRTARKRNLERRNTVHLRQLVNLFANRLIQLDPPSLAVKPRRANSQTFQEAAHHATAQRKPVIQREDCVQIRGNLCDVNLVLPNFVTTCPEDLDQRYAGIRKPCILAALIRFDQQCELALPQFRLVRETCSDSGRQLRERAGEIRIHRFRPSCLPTVPQAIPQKSWQEFSREALLYS